MPPVVTQATIPECPGEIDSLIHLFGAKMYVRFLTCIGEAGAEGADANREDGPATGDRSSVATWLATFHGLRQGSGVSIVPSRIRLVPTAIAASRLHASTP